jgi:hypothetical protein
MLAGGALGGFVACGGVPLSVKAYAADLPARADGQYAFLDDDDVRKQLVLKDSLLQCKIDVEEGAEESKSAACRCSTSAGDWRADCKAWLGNHVPPAPAATPAAPAPAPAPAPEPAPPS